MRRLIDSLFGLGMALLVQILPAPAQPLPLGSAGHCASRYGNVSPQASCRIFHLTQGVSSECMAACQRAIASQNLNAIMQYCNHCEAQGRVQQYEQPQYDPYPVKCGSYSCQEGNKCARGGARACIPEDADDCGGGRHCPAGTTCSRAPANVSGISRELKCATEEQARNLESLIARERDEAERRKREQLAQKKREDEEKAKAVAEAKLKATVPGRQKVSDLLKQSQESKREADLKKAAEAKQQELQRALAPSQQKTPAQQLCDLGWEDANTPEWKSCMIGARPRPVAPLPTSPPPDPDWTRRQLDALARGETTAKSPAPTQPPPVQGPLTRQQYDFLKQNAAGLQPEQRKISGLSPPRIPSNSTAPPASATTFAPNRPAAINAPTERPVRLSNMLGPNANKVDVPVDKARAQYVLPYAALANDAYGGRAGALPAGIVKVEDWDAALRRSGVKQETIQAYRDAGFYAAIYRNERTGEVAVAFRGTQRFSPDDLRTDILARGGVQTKQYEAAAKLSAAVKEEYKSASNIVLTGHSLGGGLASYGSSVTGLDSIAFNAARNQFSTAASTGTRLNVIAPTDPIGTEYTQGVLRQFGSGAAGDRSLPGTTMAVPATGTVPHGMEGLITALQGAAQ